MKNYRVCFQYCSKKACNRDIAKETIINKLYDGGNGYCTKVKIEDWQDYMKTMVKEGYNLYMIDVKYKHNCKSRYSDKEEHIELAARNKTECLQQIPYFLFDIENIEEIKIEITDEKRLFSKYFEGF